MNRSFSSVETDDKEQIPLDWQTLIALIIVTLAGLAQLPRLVGMFRANQKPSCGSCGGCSSTTAKAIQKPLVRLNEISDRRK